MAIYIVILFLARATLLYKSLFCMSVSQLVSALIFLGFSLVKTPVSGSGSGVPNQRLCVFVLFQLSTTWLNSTVKGSAPRLLTRQLYSPVYSICAHTATPEAAPLTVSRSVTP